MRCSFILCLIVLLRLPFFTQNDNAMNNVWGENWLSSSINLELNKLWEISLEEQIRIKNVNELYDRSFTELKLERYYPVSRSEFNFGFAYRYIFLNDDSGGEQGIEKHQRLSYYYTQKFERNRFSFRYRVQYQKRRELLAKTNKHVGDFRKYWRIKTDFNYNFKSWKFDPKISTELFLRSSDSPTNQRNKYRISIGTRYRLNKKHDFVIKYLFEKQIKSWNPDVIHAIALKYNLRVKRANEKKENDK